MMTWLASPDYFATIDIAQQVVIIAHRASWLPAETTREIRIADIEFIYLDFWQDSVIVDSAQGDYGSADDLRFKRHRLMGARLNSGETVTLREEVVDQPRSAVSQPDPQRANWESLARQVSDLLNKPLLNGQPLPSGPRSFVEAIDEILQRRLEQSPLKERSIRLRGKGFGIEIVVDGKVYGGLDEIEEDSARSLVQDAVDEWQRRNP